MLQLNNSLSLSAKAPHGDSMLGYIPFCNLARVAKDVALP